MLHILASGQLSFLGLIQMANQFEGIAPPRQIILDTTQHQRAAMALGAGADFFQAQPRGADDAFIQRALRIEAGQRAELRVDPRHQLLDEPAPNLQLGAAFLASLLVEFPDPRLAAAAYNAGPARVREWWAARRSDDVEVFVEQIPFDETRHFVKRVMVAWEEYRRIYGAGPQSEIGERGGR